MTARKPAAKPAVDFVIPASKAATKDGQVSFMLDGTRYTLPKLQYLSMESAAAAAAFESGEFDVSNMREVLSTMFGDEELVDVLLKSSMDRIEFLIEHWREASDISVGESPASED